MNCDCFSCKYSDDPVEWVTEPTPETPEEVPMHTILTCTCTKRYVYNELHDADCDLNMIDEFWAGLVIWDPDSESVIEVAELVDADDPYQWEDDLIVSDERQVQAALEAMEDKNRSKRDEDIAMTTDMFIEKMLKNSPSSDGTTWIKNADGTWEASSPTYQTTTQISQKWDKALAGTGISYLSDRHCEQKVPFPSGEVEVQCTSHSEQRFREGDAPDFALYLDMCWVPEGMAVLLPWQDYGLPRVDYSFADYAIEEAYRWAKGGAIVEVGCIGSHGRTGTVLACMAIIDDPTLSAEEAIKYVRTAYCHHAIESRDQEWYVARFHAIRNNLPVPEKPEFVPRAQVKTGQSESILATAQQTLAELEARRKGNAISDSPKVLGTPESHADGPTGKRRGKRGGRRVQRQKRNYYNRSAKR